ncbi:hypothetical protein HOT49_gp204 [Erwinia phage vB_EamM_Alexandra]|uniref:Uncharacterized protein n=1 Tax=Erwinia phage vB_EamM_Alexandra TaxID=2201424 RepID=A0A2Z4QDX1_9CAUD|nr:hypothetical protein HOT49_gp204 [Erwinia phage vB_EamM_Alexandra]AWY08470.1 hypothetical protein Alexandra_206 [Erwinia phage vB_EamM_Alexandra]
MSRNIHDVERHDTLMVQTDPKAEPIWNVCPGKGLGSIEHASFYAPSNALSPRQMAELSHVRESMSGYSDEDLESYARIGRKAQLALDLRRSKSSITPAQVDAVCQPTMKR